MKFISLFIALVVASVFGQDMFNMPHNLLADINPGPDSSNPGVWYKIDAVGKAYTTVTITGKIFDQLVVTDGTTAGTKLLKEFNLANRGDPYVKDPFWTPSKDYGIKYFYIFDGILWFSVYNFNLPGWTVWNLDPMDDIPKPYEGPIIKTTNPESLTTFFNIQQIQLFKGEYYGFKSDNSIESGLYKFDKSFTSFTVFNNASDFLITPDPYDGFYGFSSGAEIFYITDDFMIIEGRVQGYDGLWVFDGAKFWPIISMEMFQVYPDLKKYDPVNNKFYYIAYFNNTPQVVVSNLAIQTSNYIILTNLNQECFPIYKCYSYLDVLNEDDGTMVFVYNTQLGFTDGSVTGTSLMLGTPRVYEVHGVFKGKVYFNELTADYSLGSTTASDGTTQGTTVVLEVPIASKFIHFEGNLFFTAGGQFMRLDGDTGEFIAIRSNISVTGLYQEVTLPNNNTQLYLYEYDKRYLDRGRVAHHFYIYVTDGHGIVRFSDDFRTRPIQSVFLNNRFLMGYQSAETGTELYYMDVAAESYETPPPETPITSSATSFIFWYLFILIVLAKLL